MNTGLNIKIEKGIPIPPRTTARNSEIYEAFDQMEVGDSFAIRQPIKEPKHVQQRMSAWNKNKRNVEKKLSSRILESNVEGKYIRIWRIK